jgi:hypothetical protein
MSERRLAYIPPGWLIVENAINGGQFGISISMCHLSIESRKNLTALSDLTLGMTVGGDAGKSIALLREVAEAMKQAALPIGDGSPALAPAAETPDVGVVLAAETPLVQIATLAAAAHGFDGGTVTPVIAPAAVENESSDEADAADGEPDSKKPKTDE